MLPNHFLCKHGGSLLVTLQLALKGLWGLRHYRPGNFKFRPLPHARGHLVNDGHCRWIRHPMYSAIACAAAAA
jgi:protein-S-isoprenylcysteine O-methyltransferase Ste14